jgi:PAS domain S-box-containing protein
LDTEHKKAETSLLKSEEKYRTLLESTLDFVFTVDRKGIFTYINPRFETVTGHRAADLIGRSFITVIPPESVAIATTQFKRGFKGEKDAPSEINQYLQRGCRPESHGIRSGSRNSEVSHAGRNEIRRHRILGTS